MNKQKKKDFDTVKYMRQQRNKVDKDLEGKNKEEILEYFKQFRPIEKPKEEYMPTTKYK